MEPESTETVVLVADVAGDVVRQMLGLYDAPAYVRRALQTESAIEAIFRRCQDQRSEWLKGVRLHWRSWNALAGADGRLETNLSEAARSVLAALRLRLADEDCTVPGRSQLPRAAQVYANLGRSIARFNRRWTTFVETMDLAPVNASIDGYNRHYVFEKECVVGSARLALHGFVPLAPLTVRQLFDRWPPLPELPPA